MRKLISIDLSGSCTGWCVFDLDTKKLEKWGIVEPIMPKGYTTFKYPKKAFMSLTSMANQVADLVHKLNPDIILIEEVNRGISRIGQKVLCGAHWFLIQAMYEKDSSSMDRIRYLDSNGREGWRPLLGLRLSKADKDQNKKIRAEAKKKKVKNPNVVDWKLLAERWVNAKYGTNFNVQEVDGDADICDAIACGDAFVNYVLKP